MRNGVESHEAVHTESGGAGATFAGTAVGGRNGTVVLVLQTVVAVSGLRTAVADRDLAHVALVHPRIVPGQASQHSGLVSRSLNASHVL